MRVSWKPQPATPLCPRIRYCPLPDSELARGLGIDDNNLSEMETELKRDSLVQSPPCGEKGGEHCQPEPAMGDQIIETHREVGSVETLCGAYSGSLSVRTGLAFVAGVPPPAGV